MGMVATITAERVRCILVYVVVFTGLEEDLLPLAALQATTGLLGFPTMFHSTVAIQS